MPEGLPSGSEIHAALSSSPFLKFWDVISDAYKLMKGREDIQRAVSEAIDAADVAAHSLQAAARDAAVMTEKLRVAKELILTATD